MPFQFAHATSEDDTSAKSQMKHLSTSFVTAKTKNFDLQKSFIAALNCPQWQNAELHRVRGTKRRPRKANIKRCHCTGDVKGGLNASLALVSSPGVACGFRYDPNHTLRDIGTPSVSCQCPLGPK